MGKDAPKSCEHCFSRREMLESGAHLALAVAGIGLAASCGERKSTQPPSATASVTADANGQATLDFTTFPNLALVGGSYLVNVNANGSSQVLSVVRVSQTQATAVSPICTHQGCTLNAYNNGYSCPCHGASFAADGTVTGGPARASLTSYPAQIGATAVVLALR